MWRTYDLELSEDSTTDSLVIKLCEPALCDTGEEEDNEEEEEGDLGRISVQDARMAIKRELDVIHGPLASLQEKVIPRFLGVYVGRRRAKGRAGREQEHSSEVWAIVMQKGKHILDPREMDLDCGEGQEQDQDENTVRLVPHER